MRCCMLYVCCARVLECARARVCAPGSPEGNTEANVVRVPACWGMPLTPPPPTTKRRMGNPVKGLGMR
jgi:hypothetical protein